MKQKIELTYDYIDWRKSAVITVDVKGTIPSRLVFSVRGKHRTTVKAASIEAMEVIGHALNTLAHEVRRNEGDAHSITTGAVLDVTNVQPKGDGPSV